MTWFWLGAGALIVVLGVVVLVQRIRTHHRWSPDDLREVDAAAREAERSRADVLTRTEHSRNMRWGGGGPAG